ncbi:MAG: hypothetical protein MSG64_03740 [Pyrinomonadaceae bacterium MAG19_C2-C3]|nr:hypothetical protein [Pyrinomonadaceae bacterium MAG19_C2-C3]
MITGFNTDVEHDGITYHVQTEDKGLQSPLILTLVYHGGAILAARRTPYDDLIGSGFQESTLAERLARQHKLICAAIKVGRLKDLQRKSEPPPATIIETSVLETKGADFNRDNLNQSSPLDLLPAPEIDVAAASQSSPADLLTPDHLSSGQTPLPSQPSTVRIAKSGIADFARVADDAARLPQLALLDEQPLLAGEHVKLRVHVFDDTGNPRKFAGATIKIKIIGTAFPPVQHQTNANGESIATFNLSLPAFKAGRAVLLVTASISGYELELRRIIKVHARATT